MTPKRAQRTQPCSRAQAQTRLVHAEKFLEVADLVVGEGDHAGYGSVSASLAVLPGIAASDAACCSALGRRSRSPDHHDAEELLAEVQPGGATAAKALRRLLNIKDTAHYGLISVGKQDLKVALRQARLVEFARQTLRR